MADYYTITDIRVKSGELKPVHEDVLGRHCFLRGGFGIGNAVWLICDVEYDPAKLHRLRTSALKDVNISDDGIITLQTMNTEYTLRPEDDPETYADLYSRCPYFWRDNGVAGEWADNPVFAEA